MRTAPVMASLEEQVKVLKKKKTKAEAFSAKYRGRYKDFEKEKRGMEKTEK